MPPLYQSLYSLGCCFTGPMILLALSSPALAENDTVVVSHVEARADATGEAPSVETPVGITAPLLAQSALTYLPAQPSPSISTDHSPAAGAWVPWNVAQALPAPDGWSAPATGLPAGAYAPAAMPYPGTPYPGGMWMMVWMPTYVPLAPEAPGMSALPSGYVQPLPGIPSGAVGPGQSPGAMSPYPTSMVAVPWGVPYGYGLPAIPTGGYPSGPASTAAPPPNGVGLPYGVPQAYGVLQAYGVPQSYAGQSPYSSVPTGSTPLAVPALLGGSTATAPPPSTAEPWPQLGAAPGQAALPGTSAPGIYAPPLNQGLAQGGLDPIPLPSQTPGVNPVPLGPELGLTSAPVPEPRLDVQGLYVLQGDRSSARARLSGDAFLTPNLLVGGAIDLVTGRDLASQDGVQLTELYLATSVAGVPGLRFRLGQLDLTSYFDRNSFAKDISRDFFNSTFQTNPALIGGANAASSRPGGLVQWAITDDIALNAAVFSSSSAITDFALDGFAGELGFRTGDLVLRGTFITSRDTGFQGTGGRLDGYGLNAEWFIPNANLGLFGRYGHLNNSTTGFSEDTYSVGLNLLDVFMENDRLGLGYGRNLTTTVASGQSPDVLELFYDFEVIPNIRLGFTFQQRDQLQESYAGFRIRSDFNLLPGRSLP